MFKIYNTELQYQCIFLSEVIFDSDEDDTMDINGIVGEALVSIATVIIITIIIIIIII